MKFLITIYCLFILSATVKAQEQTVVDSVLLYKQAQQNFQSLKWGVSQLVNTEFNKAAYVGLNYNLQNGHFRPAQQAERSSSATLSTEGISTISRFKLYGYFSFNRSWLDSLAFSQKGIDDPYQPYYYIAGKAGIFERQNYLGGGIITYNLIKDKLFLGTGIDYLYGSSARSVDPRSLITTFKLKFNPQLTYKIHKQTFGIGIEAGYGDESVSIDYKNDDYKGSLLYPDRISYFNYGYGYLEMSQTGFNRKNQYTGINLNYGIKAINWDLTSKLSYLIAKEDNRFPKTNSVNDQTFGTYQLETYKVDLLFNEKSTLNTQQILVHIQQDNGDDHLIKLAARNYTFSATTFNLFYSHYQHRKSGASIEWFGQANYKKVTQRDAAADHTINYSYVNPKIGSVLYWKNSKSNLLSTELVVGARLPLHHQINVPLTQVNSFTEGVAYPDHLYWASVVGETQFRINYTTEKLIEKFKTGLSLSSTYLHQLHQPASNYKINFIPAKNYLDLNLAINLYF